MAGDGCLYAGGTYREAQGVDRKGQLVEAYAFLAESAAKEDPVKKSHKAGSEPGQCQDESSLYDRVFLYHGRLRGTFITAYSRRGGDMRNPGREKWRKRGLTGRRTGCYPTNRNSK